MNKNVIHHRNVISAVIHKKMNQIHMAVAPFHTCAARTYLHREQRRAAAAAAAAMAAAMGAEKGSPVPLLLRCAAGSFRRGGAGEWRARL